MTAPMRISCAFAPAASTPNHIVLAEKLGYERAWCYDSPALYSDAWMTLALAAEQTTRIGLGPAVLIPSLRHPMVNAAAIAGLAGIAPGRVAAVFGAGFSGRYTLGQPPMRWADVGGLRPHSAEFASRRRGHLGWLRPQDVGAQARRRAAIDRRGRTERESCRGRSRGRNLRLRQAPGRRRAFPPGVAF